MTSYDPSYYRREYPAAHVIAAMMLGVAITLGLAFTLVYLLTNLMIPGAARDAEEVWGADRIIRHFGISEHAFLTKHLGYTPALQSSVRTSHWNEEIDELAREANALTEWEIELARSDFSQAVLNRVKLALSMERIERAEGH
jgi:hypothetical protein